MKFSDLVLLAEGIEDRRWCEFAGIPESCNLVVKAIEQLAQRKITTYDEFVKATQSVLDEFCNRHQYEHRNGWDVLRQTIRNTVVSLMEKYYPDKADQIKIGVTIGTVIDYALLADKNTPSTSIMPEYFINLGVNRELKNNDHGMDLTF